MPDTIQSSDPARPISTADTTAASPRADIKGHPQSPYVRCLPLIVLAISLTMTLLYWSLLDSSIKSRAFERYRDRNEEISRPIMKRLMDHEQVLRGALGLFNASDNVSRDEWRRYVAALQLGENHPGIQGLGFAQWLISAEKADYIRRIRAEGFADYTIRPAGQRAIYTSIIYLEPFNWRNQRAFGYDMYSEPVRRAAMDRAMDQGTVAVSGKVKLVQETETDIQSGILMYLPVYRTGMATSTMEERRRAIMGFVYSPIRLNDFVYGTLGKLPNDIAFDIYAADSPQPDALVFSSLAANRNGLPPDYKAQFTSNIKFEACGRTWLITFKNLPPFVKELGHRESYTALVSGLVVSLLLTLIATLMLLAHKKAVILTSEISVQKNELETTLARIRRLEGIIPICMYCKSIRSDNDSWHQLETYISEHSEAMFSHGICPECYSEQQKQLARLAELKKAAATPKPTA